MMYSRNAAAALVLLIVAGCVSGNTKNDISFENSYCDYLVEGGYKGKSRIEKHGHCSIYIPASAYELIRLAESGIPYMTKCINNTSDPDKKEYAKLLLFLMKNKPQSLLFSIHPRNGVRWYNFRFKPKAGNFGVTH